MVLTDAQKTVLRNAVLADPTLNTLPHNTDGAAPVAAALNVVDATFFVYKTSVTNEAIGDAMNGTEITGLSSLGMQRLQVLGAYSNGTQNPSRADRRAAFDAVFNGAGGAATRAALAVLWKRNATRAEKLLKTTTGAGTSADPVVLGAEGSVFENDVMAFMGW